MSLPLTAKGTLGPVGTAGNPGSSFMLEMGREKWYQKQVPRMIRFTTVHLPGSTFTRVTAMDGVHHSISPV